MFRISMRLLKRLLVDRTLQFTIVFLTINLLICLLLVGNVYFNTDFLMKRYVSDYHVDRALHISDEELYFVTDTIIDLIKGNSIDYEFKAVVKGIKSTFLNSKEIRHVKELATAFNSFRIWFFRIVLLDILLFILLVRRRGQSDIVKDISKGFLIAQLLFATAFTTFGIWYATNPVRAINTIHKIFFKGDNWIMNPVTDKLIYLCPEQLITYCVMDMCKIVVTYILVGSSMAIGALMIGGEGGPGGRG